MAHPIDTKTGATPAIRRVVIVAAVTNLLLGACKVTAGIIGNSYALIADGIESLVDLAAGLLVYGAVFFSQRPADERHPYGHGKAESLAGLFVALLLCGAAVWVAVQSVEALRTPQPPPAPWTLVVLLIVVIAKWWVGRTISAVATMVGSVALSADAAHQRSDAITSLAAGIGISLALVGGPSWAFADGGAALFASGIILMNGINLVTEAMHDLLDAAPPGDIADRVTAQALNVPGVKGVEQCRVRRSGTQYLVDMHLIVSGDITVHAGHEIARLVRRTVCQDPQLRVQDVLIHVEPD